MNREIKDEANLFEPMDQPDAATSGEIIKTGDNSRDLIRKALEAEGVIKRSDPSEWDNVYTGNIGAKEQTFLAVTGDLENTMLRLPNSRESKTEIETYLNKLDPEYQNIVIQWIKDKIDDFISRLKERILSGQIVLNEDSYFSFLSTLRTNVTLKYPLNESLQKYLAESLLKMYLEVSAEKKIPAQFLMFLLTWIELFISGFKNNLKIPQSFQIELSKLTDEEFDEKTCSKPLGKSGNEGITSYIIFPLPDRDILPDIEPFKTEAMDLLEELRESAYATMKQAVSVENYFYFKAETSGANKFSEMELAALINLEKRKLDKLSTKVEELTEKLRQTLSASGNYNKKTSEKSLAEYKAKIESHLKSIWEKAIFPHLVFYTQLLFGKSDNKS